MNEDTLNDLKQFIAATVSQATAGMAKKEHIANLATKEDIQELSAKIGDLDLKVDTISEALHESVSEHESRLMKLEQQAA